MVDESGELKVVSQTSYDYTRPYWDQIGVTIVGRHVFDMTDGWDGKPPGGTSVKDMHRATTFEAGNPRSIARTEFETMAQAADKCITKVAGLDTVGEQVVRHQNTSLLTQMIIELEARLTEPASGFEVSDDLFMSRGRPGQGLAATDPSRAER
ncbi:hypothetical protein [Microtetraspora malaysiensis]|uniref:hypothetical protein n=1 Tax=Microtetraspora malaysiensis TaxID=161358 RepID=UPI003D9410FD